MGNSRRQIMEQCDASLKAAQDGLDRPVPDSSPHVDCPIDETLRALDDLICAGQVRYIGTSTFAAWQVVESLWVSDRHHLNRFVCEQPPYNLLDRRIERELLPMLKTYGFGVIPWSPLAGGFLSGKYRRDGEQPTDGRYSDGSHFRANKMIGNDRAYDAVDAIQALGEGKGCTISQLSSRG